MIFLKLEIKQKAILIIIFIFTEIITYKTIEYMNYLNNSWLINLIVIVFPIFTIGISYQILNNRQKLK